MVSSDPSARPGPRQRASTLRRVKPAARAAERAGILERRSHGRPNGRQGSNTYLFDAVLVRLAHDDANAVFGDLPCLTIVDVGRKAGSWVPAVSDDPSLPGLAVRSRPLEVGVLGAVSFTLLRM